MKWYYETGGAQQGPVDEVEIRRLFTAGEITPSSRVWHKEMADWTPAGEVLGPAPAPKASAPVVEAAHTASPAPGPVAPVQAAGQDLAERAGRAARSSPAPTPLWKTPPFLIGCSVAFVIMMGIGTFQLLSGMPDLPDVAGMEGITAEQLQAATTALGKAAELSVAAKAEAPKPSAPAPPDDGGVIPVELRGTYAMKSGASCAKHNTTVTISSQNVAYASSSRESCNRAFSVSKVLRDPPVYRFKVPGKDDFTVINSADGIAITEAPNYVLKGQFESESERVSVGLGQAASEGVIPKVFRGTFKMRSGASCAKHKTTVTISSSNVTYSSRSKESCNRAFTVSEVVDDHPIYRFKVPGKDDFAITVKGDGFSITEAPNYVLKGLFEP